MSNKSKRLRINMTETLEMVFQNTLAPISENHDNQIMMNPSYSKYNLEDFEGRIAKEIKSLSGIDSKLEEEKRIYKTLKRYSKGKDE